MPASDLSVFHRTASTLTQRLLPELPAGCHYQWQHKYDINQQVNHRLPDLPALSIKKIKS